MSYEYSENELVQNSAIELLRDTLKWRTFYAYNDEVLDDDSSPKSIGRKSYKEILLTRYLKEAVFKLNDWMTDDIFEKVLKILNTKISSDSAIQTNEKNYNFFKEGIEVDVQDENGSYVKRKAQLFDFNHPEENDFLAVQEMKIWGEVYHRRADIVGFVNGIPLLFVELKRDDIPVENAYNDNYKDYQTTIPQLFYYNAFIMFANGPEAKVGTLGAKFKFFHEWKRLSEDDEEGSVAFETMLLGMCNKKNFMDLFENFILFDHSNGRAVKILARNHQFLGVNQAFENYKARKFKNGKLGVFWHTQGSGKSYSMVFLSQKIHRKLEGSPTIVILTDRTELNKQISGTFEACGCLGNVKAGKYIASSGSDLITKLKGNPSYIFSLIQKFNQPDEKPIHTDYDILLISDEAHRSQNGVYANNMCKLLPEASRIGFTGTPLFSFDNITQRTFGDYVSIYDFKRAVDDGATVPLYYENRGEKLLLDNPEINDKLLEAIEQIDDEEKRAKVENLIKQELHIIRNPKRLDKIARDFVNHYSEVWQTGKAMFVSVDRLTSVQMLELCQKYWKEKITEFEAKAANLDSDQELQDLQTKIEWMKATEMCVVISQEQGEVEYFKKHDIDIIPHRKKMMERELDKEFKDENNPFRVVFVCAMWLTGFDCPSLSVLYLDKPLKAHTLMQTIARANRVNDGKENGLIEDYIGIVTALEKALVDYTTSGVGNAGNGHKVTIDREKLVAAIYEDAALAIEYLKQHGFDIKDLINSRNFARIKMIQTGANSVAAPDEVKKEFCTKAGEFFRLYKYAVRSEITAELKEQHDALEAIYRQLTKPKAPVDVDDIMKGLEEIVNEYISTEETPDDAKEPNAKIDISQIDFDKLATEFAKIKNKKLVINDINQLVTMRLAQMLKTNPGRIDYYKHYQEVIEEYNRSQDKAVIEQVFNDLLQTAKDMTEEQKRYVREGFESDEELTIYDMLFKDSLTKEDIKKIKELSKELLKKIKSLLAEMDSPFDKDATVATIQNEIRNTLYAELPDDCMSDFDKYRQSIFDYLKAVYSAA